MGTKAAIGAVLVGIAVWMALGAAPLGLDPEIYIGEQFRVTVDVADTLIILNLNDPVRIYEFEFPEPGALKLCFVRPCDPCCEGAWQGQLIAANPGDQILFVLKNHPQEMEVRKTVHPSRHEAEVTVDIQIVEQDGCLLQFTVSHKAADLTCGIDRVTAHLFLGEEAEASALELVETDPASGVFLGFWPFSIDYADGKFRVNGGVFALPQLPRILLEVDQARFTFDLVKALPQEILEAMPAAVRLNCVPHFLAQLPVWVAPSHVYTHVEEERLWVVVKAGCTYYGAKEVRVLPEVNLEVTDAAGRSVQGGYIEAGKEYRITAVNGLADGCILVVELGCNGGACGPVHFQQTGFTHVWTPDATYVGKTVAIVYIDRYLCAPPALIFTVD